MYLYMLREYINNLPRHEWRMISVNEAAKKLLSTATGVFEHRFPLPTTIPHPEECWFKFTKAMDSGSDKEYFMCVLDTPGELYENPDKALDAAGNNFLEAYLRSCSGLLCFVDPDQGEDEPMLRFLRGLLINLGHNQECIEKRFAFCLTKMDSPRHRRYWQSPQDYIRQKLGDQMYKTILQACAPGNANFSFACSAVGFYHYSENGQLFLNPADKKPRSNSGIDWYGRAIIYDTKYIQPINLFEPLKWLFDAIA